MTTLSDPLVGVSPLVAAAATVLGASAIQNHSAQFFRNMARPGGYLTTAGKLDPQKAMEIGKRWSDNYGAAVNAGKTAVLEQGLEYKTLTMTAVDAQLIEQMRWSVEDIARVFQIPSFMIGDATKGVYKSAEMLNAIYLSSALDAHFHAIESRLNLFFELTGTDEYLQFDRDALFRTDLDARVGSYAKGVAGGILTPDEARAAAFNINPVEGGDQVYMQQQMVPISMLRRCTSRSWRHRPRRRPRNRRPPRPRKSARRSRSKCNGGSRHGAPERATASATRRPRRHLSSPNASSPRCSRSAPSWPNARTRAWSGRATSSAPSSRPRPPRPCCTPHRPATAATARTASVGAMASPGATANAANAASGSGRRARRVRPARARRA
jgi:phage portal protein, HK97 family